MLEQRREGWVVPGRLLQPPASLDFGHGVGVVRWAGLVVVVMFVHSPYGHTGNVAYLH